MTKSEWKFFLSHISLLIRRRLDGRRSASSESYRSHSRSRRSRERSQDRESKKKKKKRERWDRTHTAPLFFCQLFMTSTTIYCICSSGIEASDCLNSSLDFERSNCLMVILFFRILAGIPTPPVTTATTGRRRRRRRGRRGRRRSNCAGSTTTKVWSDEVRVHHGLQRSKYVRCHHILSFFLILGFWQTMNGNKIFGNRQCELFFVLQIVHRYSLKIVTVPLLLLLIRDTTRLPIVNRLRPPLLDWLRGISNHLECWTGVS